MSSKLIVDTIEDSTGTYSLALGSGNSTFPGGIHIGGTGSANLLDDYEEGTWTPTIGFTTTDGTIAYTAQEGSYTKVGRLVYINGCIILSSISGESGDLQLRGLPFTPENTLASTSNEHAVVFHYISSPQVDGKVTGYILGNNTQVASITNKSDLSSVVGAANVGGSFSCRFHGVYQTT